MINKDIQLNNLSKSKFRSSFKLHQKDIDYINRIGFDKLRCHAYDFITNRIAILNQNDGRQTPTKGHPVFIAQHATATCCRGCINKWYGIEKTKDLSKEEIDYIVDIIMKWILKEYNRMNK